MTDQPKDASQAEGAAGFGPSLPTSLGFKLRRIQLAYNRQFQQFASHIAIPTNQLGALSLICRNPDIAPGDLAALLIVDAAQLTPIIKQLEARGLVGRRKSAADSRSHQLRATPAGEAKYHEFRAVIGEFEAVFVGEVLEAEEARQLHDLLGRLESAARSRN